MFIRYNPQYEKIQKLFKFDSEITKRLNCAEDVDKILEKSGVDTAYLSIQFDAKMKRLHVACIRRSSDER